LPVYLRRPRRGRVALAGAQYHGHVIGEIHDRGRLHAAVAAVDDQIHVVLEQFADFVGVDQRQLIVGHDQGNAHQRLVEVRQQRLGDRVVGDAQTHGAPLRVHESTRHLGGGTQNERVGTGRVRFQQPIDRVVDARVGGQLRQVAAHEGEVMACIEAPDTANTIQRRLVADLAAERVGRVRRIHDDAAGAHDIHGLANEPRLRILRMYLEKLAHGRCASSLDVLFYNAGPLHMARHSSTAAPCNPHTPA
jgi:hypothetical protein